MGEEKKLQFFLFSHLKLSRERGEESIPVALLFLSKRDTMQEK
jgi:hypothetical protein